MPKVLLPNDSFSQIKRAYLTLKREVYSQRHNLRLRQRIAEFESQGDLSEKLLVIHEVAQSNSPVEHPIMRQWLLGISSVILPKTVKSPAEVKDGAKPIRNGARPNFFTNKMTDDYYETGKVNYFFDGPVELHVLSVLWLLEEGRYLDAELSDACVGMRLHNRVQQQKSVIQRLFRPYRNRGKYKSCYVSKRLKRYYAPGEVAEIEGRFLSVPPEASQAYDLFRWRGATFTVFNCFELTNISERSWFRGKVDFLVCSEANTDTNYFSNIVEASARDLHCYVVQTNDATYGDSRVVAPSKTEQMNLIRVKGGENETFLWTTLELNKLRQHQNKAHSLQTRKNAPFKATPAGWNRNHLADRLHKPRRTR